MRIVPCPVRLDVPHSPVRARSGFSLVEVVASVAVLLLLFSIIFAITNSVSATVSRTSAKIDAFASARAAFTLVSQKLSKATLNTYWDYYYADSSDGTAANSTSKIPSSYIRQSDLQFAIVQNTQNAGYGQEIYFVAPESYSASGTIRSTSGLLNACGFFVQYGSNEGFLPTALSAGTEKHRYRLMQGMQPTENLSVFDRTSSDPRVTDLNRVPDWAAQIKNNGSALPPDNVKPLADNVIALVVWPHKAVSDDSEGTALTSDYTYNSRFNAISSSQPATANQLPPTVQLTMIVVSERSMARLQTGSAGDPPSVIENILNGRFATLGTNGGQYATDIAAIQTGLSANKIEFEIFTTTIPLRESKWSDSN